jgi:hypothetical protein
MITGPHNGIALDDHGSDHGVGAGFPFALPGQAQGQAHEPLVAWIVFHAMSGWISLSKANAYGLRIVTLRVT